MWVWLLQVTGDPNVPAGKVTLFTLDLTPTTGRYRGYEEGPHGNVLPDRPIGARLAFPLSHAPACHMITHTLLLIRVLQDHCSVHGTGIGLTWITPEPQVASVCCHSRGQHDTVHGNAQSHSKKTE